jgi:very-short-patch-repair endonuclease
MRVSEVLARLGGVAEAATLVELTSRGRVRAALVRGDIVRDNRGRYGLTSADVARRAANRLSGVVSHQSAATDLGWELKQVPELPIVTVPRNRKVTAERRVGVDLRWGLLSRDEISRSGVTAPTRTVIDCAKSLPFDEALVVGDSALRHGNLTRGRLIEAANDVRGPGRAACIRVAEHADGRAANPFESVLRAIALGVPGLAVEPQVLITEAGFAVRPDLVDWQRRLVLEADSYEFHGKRKLMKRDCERYDLLVLAGWTVLRFTWEHVMFQPEFVRACLRVYVGGGDLEDASLALRLTA